LTFDSSVPCPLTDLQAIYVAVRVRKIRDRFLEHLLSHFKGTYPPHLPHDGSTDTSPYLAAYGFGGHRNSWIRLRFQQQAMACTGIHHEFGAYYFPVGQHYIGSNVRLGVFHRYLNPLVAALRFEVRRGGYDQQLLFIVDLDNEPTEQFISQNPVNVGSQVVSQFQVILVQHQQRMSGPVDARQIQGNVVRDVSLHKTLAARPRDDVFLGIGKVKYVAKGLLREDPCLYACVDYEFERQHAVEDNRNDDQIIPQLKGDLNFPPAFFQHKAEGPLREGEGGDKKKPCKEDGEPFQHTASTQQFRDLSDNRSLCL